MIVAALFGCLLLSACQPIQPIGIGATALCTDADKIALLQTYVDAYGNQDPETSVALFLPDGKLSGTAGPVLDPTSGVYTAFEVEFNGHEEIFGIVQWFIEGAHLTTHIHDPVVQGDTVTAPGVVVTPFYYAHAIPAKELDLVYTMQVENCKIANLRWDYTAESLAALPAAAEALASTCADDYKLGALQSYMSGINEFDAGLAAWPFAEDAYIAIDLIPELDEATQTYHTDAPIVLARSCSGVAVRKASARSGATSVRAWSATGATDHRRKAVSRFNAPANKRDSTSPVNSCKISQKGR
jgi:hypothetical protein